MVSDKYKDTIIYTICRPCCLLIIFELSIVYPLKIMHKIKINEGLKGASKGHRPISLEKLKQENKSLYGIVANKLC